MPYNGVLLPQGVGGHDTFIAHTGFNTLGRAVYRILFREAQGRPYIRAAQRSTALLQKVASAFLRFAAFSNFLMFMFCSTRTKDCA